MALDTIGLVSESIDEDVACQLERQCVLRQGTDLRSGEILYQITTGFLSGSYDHRICFRVERSSWQAQPKGPPLRVPCNPYLYIEGSVHKAILGHNVFGGPVNFRAAAWWLVDSMMNLFDIPLPLADFWGVQRVDWAELWQLPSFESVSEYFRGLNASDYPRRQVNRYGLSGLYAPGSTTATKFYHKGPEFAKHDRSRLKKLLSASQLNELQLFANKLLRAEVEIKKEKLVYDFGYIPKVPEIDEAYLNKVFDQEVFRILRDGVRGMEVVREARAVQRRLHELHGSHTANSLFGVWVQFSTLGEEAYKKSTSKPTFYRHRKQLVEAGCDWHATDVILLEHSLIPSGFSLRRGNSWHLSSEHPKVAEQLAPYRDIPLVS